MKVAKLAEKKTAARRSETIGASGKERLRGGLGEKRNPSWQILRNER